jgi:hypothetical protein
MKQKTLSVIDEIKRDPAYYRQQSIGWFQKRIEKLGGFGKNALMKNTGEIQKTKIFPGALNFFSYDPKLKEELPYYDKFPLSFIIGVDETGFTGINFHYLPYPVRVKLYDKMWNVAKLNVKQPAQRVIQLNWQLLGAASKFPEVQPAVKRYLYNHVRSRFIQVPIEDWKIALMLPNEQFVKAPTSAVHRTSMRMIAGRRH